MSYKYYHDCVKCLLIFGFLCSHNVLFGAYKFTIVFSLCLSVTMSCAFLPLAGSWLLNQRLNVIL